MADFLSRLVERTYGLIQVAEPVIIPSFAVASDIGYTESSVFDIKPELHQGVSQPFLPRSITHVKHPVYNAGIKEEGAVANNRAENSPFEVKPAGTQVISGHEQSDFDLLPGTMSEKTAFGKDITDVTQQLPEDATRKNEKTVYHPQRLTHEMSEHDEPGFIEDIHAEHAENGEKTVYHSQPEPVIHEMTGDDEPVFTQDINAEHAENGEKTVNRPQPMIREMSGHEEHGFTQDIHAENAKSGDKTVYHPQRLIHEMTGDDEPVFARDIHVEHAKNGEKTVYHPQPRPMISETPVNEENSSESRKTEIMAAEKKSLYQPERSLNITGTPEDEVSEDLKKAYPENMKSSKDTRGFLQVQPEGITHKSQTHRVDPGNLQKSVDKYQRNELQIEGLKPSKTGILVLERNDRKMSQTYHTSESYISTQKRREIQGSLVSTTIAPEKHIADSHSTPPAIKVTIGHVEVRAATKPAQVSVPPRQNPVLSLNDYLKKRNGNML